MKEMKHLRCRTCKVPFGFTLHTSIYTGCPTKMQEEAEEYFDKFIKNSPKMNCPVCGDILELTCDEPQKTISWDDVKWKKEKK